MNKKEKAALAAALKQAALSHALRWSVPLGAEIAPDVPVPEVFASGTAGWMASPARMMGHYDSPSESVEAMESTSGGHGRAGSQSRSQGGIALHSSRLRALRALRHGMEVLFARKLAAVDEEIAREAAAS